MLLADPRHTAADLRCWAEYERADRTHAESRQFSGRVKMAILCLDEFLRDGAAYVSVSWGKDSTVLAHLCADRGQPYVWVRQEPLRNPDCLRVRDAFLGQCPQLRYEEIVTQMRRGRTTWHATGSLEAGFREAVARHGRRYILGLRAGESGGRMIRMRHWGLSSPNACAPLGWWEQADVFAYLAKHDLPVHPAYGFLGGGRWDREQIRVCSLGGQRGAQFGRAEWEQEYYGHVLARLGHER